MLRSQFPRLPASCPSCTCWKTGNPSYCSPPPVTAEAHTRDETSISDVVDVERVAEVELDVEERVDNVAQPIRSLMGTSGRCVALRDEGWSEVFVWLYFVA